MELVEFLKKVHLVNFDINISLEVFETTAGFRRSLSDDGIIRKVSTVYIVVACE